MMKKNKITIMLSVLCLQGMAQNNPIFYGGLGDGAIKSSYIQASFNDRFIGGNGDGAVLNNYVQASVTDLFWGGSGDGFTKNEYIQVSNNASFLGGNGDGFTKGIYVQGGNDFVMNGGSGDGANTSKYIQSGDSNLFFGGVGDGWAKVTFPLGPLPIEMLSFTGRQVENTHVLDWTTAQEKNASHFVIEHSANGSSFLELGMRNAKGVSAGKTDYTFTNKKPIVGDNFYRLKLVDVDGKSKYSNVVLLKMLEDKTVISVYPNPTASHLNINVNAVKKNTQIQIIVLDMHGKITYQQSLEANNAKTSIDVSSWSSGTYFVRVVQGAVVNTIKVVKQ